jgi:tRNA A-37 threonylcarbamoyl transferase component Bud32
VIVWNPWRRIRELEAQALDDAMDIAVLERSLHHAHERYDRIRGANMQLREALSLYRAEGFA